jgi:hypothetical protein
MNDSGPSIILFIVASALVVIGRFFGLESLVLVTKPMVVPAIYFYYLQTRTQKVDVLFSIALWLFFVADMVVLLLGETGTVCVLACGIGSYCIMLKFALGNVNVIKFSFLNILFVSILLLLLSYIFFTILNLEVESIVRNYLLYLAYGIVLIILVVVATFNYLSESNATVLPLCSMALCMLISDLFYCINRFFIHLPIIDHINLFSQFLSYYFMVKYFNSRCVAKGIILTGDNL